MKTVKSLGQNFLIDNNIADKIVQIAGIEHGDLVLEIGPGLGALTSKILDRAKFVVAVEIDKRLVNVLDAALASRENLLILNNDILDMDFTSGLLEGIKKSFLEDDKRNNSAIFPEILNNACNDKYIFSSIKVISNLPYYITTPVIMKFLEELTNETDALVFMMQLEVAERLTAVPGTKEYGVLSIAAQYYATIRKIFNVPPTCFNPKPGVMSCVVRMDTLKEAPVELSDKEIFFKIFKAAFGQRRKTLLNALSAAFSSNIGRQDIATLLETSCIDPKRRGETLSSAEFAFLANNYVKLFKNSCK